MLVLAQLSSMKTRRAESTSRCRPSIGPSARYVGAVLLGRDLLGMDHEAVTVLVRPGFSGATRVLARKDLRELDLPTERPHRRTMMGSRSFGRISRPR